jgi:NAD(P)-dependent dehydrogenase (short-subunit alcohol dehydrogenase family)
LQAAQTTRIEDLRLLCSNCHRTVHAKRPWLSIEELIEILRRRERPSDEWSGQAVGVVALTISERRRLGGVEDCAKVAEFLATDLSDYVSGAVIPIGGGLVRA